MAKIKLEYIWLGGYRLQNRSSGNGGLMFQGSSVFGLARNGMALNGMQVDAV
jgi:hypothetical protein